MMSGMNIFSFLAIPFFVFSGELMLHGGIADKIVTLARNMIGHVRGGLECPTSWRARCSAAFPARPPPTSRRWAR
jgi:TRAP-type C4-dicarboxylate transport system permease large subunit